MMNYGKIASTYDDKYTSAMCIRENAAIKDILEKHVVGKRVLDVGCGTGLSLDLCKGIHPDDYCGLDVSLDMITVASRKHPYHTFVEVEAERFVTSKKYDVALCLFSIPYIGERAVTAIYEALKSGGVVVCVCYNKPYLNPSSVYGGHKWKYLLMVAWKVRAVLNRFDSLFSKVSETPLAGGHAYKVIVYRKEVRA